MDTGYPHRAEDLRFTPTAIDAISLLNRTSHWVIVVTNQSGVARGFFSLADVNAFHAEMSLQLSMHGAWIDAFYIAPYHPDGVIAEYAIDHDDRKPGPGMLRRAMQDFPIDSGASFLVGDKASDIAAAQAAGICGLQVTTDVCDLLATIQGKLAVLPQG